MKVSELLNLPYSKYLKEVKKNQQIKIEISNLSDTNVLSSESFGFNNQSPKVRWSPVEYAASYAIALVDYDATSNPSYGSPFVHWYALNIFEPELNFDVANQGFAVLYQGENSASSLFSHSLIENYCTNSSYCPPFPPNKAHKYEFKVYALKNKISTNRNEPLYFDEFEKIVDQAGVLATGVTYFNVPKLENVNDMLIVDDVTPIQNPRLFYNEDQTYHVIEDVVVEGLEKNKFNSSALFNFNDNDQTKIKIIDSSESKSYAVVVLSNDYYRTFGSPLVCYAHIVDKKTNKRIKFNNGYNSNQKIADYFDLQTKQYQNELLILNNQEEQANTYTILVYGLNESINSLNKTSDSSLAGLYETISSHVIAFTSKFIK